MKVIYKKWHNNYDELKIGNEYEAIKYKTGWLLINSVLYREECFEKIGESD